MFSGKKGRPEAEVIDLGVKPAPPTPATLQGLPAMDSGLGGRAEWVRKGDHVHFGVSPELALGRLLRWASSARGRPGRWGRCRFSRAPVSPAPPHQQKKWGNLGWPGPGGPGRWWPWARQQRPWEVWGTGGVRQAVDVQGGSWARMLRARRL